MQKINFLFKTASFLFEKNTSIITRSIRLKNQRIFTTMSNCVNQASAEQINLMIEQGTIRVLVIII